MRRAIRILRCEGWTPLRRAIRTGQTVRQEPYRPDEPFIVYTTLFANIHHGLMIDVGAHFGSSLREFARSGWRVFAFEPDTANREALARKFGRYANVHFDARAVADTAHKSAPFFRSGVSTGISALSAFHPSHHLAGQVEVTTIAEFVGEQGIADERIDFLKIDTEGYDLKVLQGVPWENPPRMILCEFEDSKTRPLGYDFHDLCKYLTNRQYRLLISEWYPVKQYGGQHEWRRFSAYPCELEDSRAWGNIIACRDDRDFDRLLGLCKR